MKNLIYRLFLTGGFMLFFQGNILAQTHNPNLHKTVTHSHKESVINRDNGSQEATRETNAQEGYMPQRKYNPMSSTKYVQSFVNETMYQVHKSGTETGLPSDFHYNMAQWTQRDMTEFAKCSNTFDTYELLLGVANVSVEKKNGKYTEDALAAQSALEAIKPASCKSWKSLAIMIGDAADATQSIRDGYRKEIEKKQHGKKHGSIIEIHKDVEYCGELPKGESPQVQALAVISELKTNVRAA